MDESEGYSFDWNCLKNAIEYMVNRAKNPDNVLCLFRGDGSAKRTFDEGSHEQYATSMDISPTCICEGDNSHAKGYDIDTPRLVLYREQGSESLGWRGAPFYWPLLYGAKNLPVAIYVDEGGLVDDY